MDSQHQNFENLRRLLTLKRHEQPPPGYFAEFHSEILARLQAGDERRESTVERLGWEVPWLHRLMEALSARPALSGGLGMAVCAVVLGGVLYAERLNMPAVVENEMGETAAMAVGTPQIAFNEPLVQESLVQAQSTSSTNPIAAGLFGAPNLPVQQVFGRPQFPFRGN